MKSGTKYGILNAFIGLIAGGCISFIATGDGYAVFMLAAPLAAFTTGWLLWKFIVKENNTFNLSKVIITGLLTGTVSHYLTFVLAGIIMNMCYLITGECTGTLGDPPADMLNMSAGAFALSFFSLLFFGWITVPASVIIGLILKRRSSP